ncbi:MAG: cytochrome P450 [Streptosporangiaceae bacterium]
MSTFRGSPQKVICELLGVPFADHGRFRSWSDAFVSTTAHTGLQIRQAAGELDAYLTGLVGERRAEPREDLLSALIQARDDGYELSERELVNLGVGLLVAGHETTAGQIANFTYVLLRHPDQLRSLRERPGLIPQAVEELLRFVPLNNSSVTMPRVAKTDLELSGTRIREGDVVLVARPSANRDESVFTDPERLDLERDARSHLAFGYGPHFCIGAQLARMELQTALAGLLDRLPEFDLAVPDADLQWKDGVMIRGLRALPIAW